MPWQAAAHPDLPVVETVYEGTLTPAELVAASEQTIALARSTGRTRLLGDCTNLQGGHSIVDLYFLADTIAATGLAGELREAILMPALPGSVEKVRFWETACANRGLRVRIFDTRQAALDWLLEADPR